MVAPFHSAARVLLPGVLEVMVNRVSPFASVVRGFKGVLEHGRGVGTQGKRGGKEGETESVSHAGAGSELDRKNIPKRPGRSLHQWLFSAPACNMPDGNHFSADDVLSGQTGDNTLVTVRVGRGKQWT